MGCHFLLQGILLTWGLKPRLLCLLHWQVDSLPRESPGKPQLLHHDNSIKLSSPILSTSLVAQLVKNLSAVQEILVPFLGWKDPLEMGKATCSSIWASLVFQMVNNLPAMLETWFDPWIGMVSWRRAWQPTPVFLPGEFHGQRCLVGCSLHGHKESDKTE